jgi:hypothetical protein
MLSLALDPGRSGFRPTVIRVRKTKSAIARNDQRDALFQRPHAAIVPDVVPDVFYRAPGTLVGSARADVEQNGRCDRHYDEYELHGSSPIGQLALNVRSEAVPPISSEISARRFTARYLPCFRQSTPEYVRRLLRCGISIRPMSASGHQRSKASKPHERACPIRSKSGQANACLDMSA